MRLDDRLRNDSVVPDSLYNLQSRHVINLKRFQVLFSITKSWWWRNCPHKLNFIFGRPSTIHDIVVTPRATPVSSLISLQAKLRVMVVKLFFSLVILIKIRILVELQIAYRNYSRWNWNFLFYKIFDWNSGSTAPLPSMKVRKMIFGQIFISIMLLLHKFWNVFSFVKLNSMLVLNLIPIRRFSSSIFLSKISLKILFCKKNSNVTGQLSEH